MTETPGGGPWPDDPHRDPSQDPGPEPGADPGRPPAPQQPGGSWEQQPQQVPYPPPPGYGYAPQPPMQYAQDHPRATTSLVLGILGVVLCQVLGPFAWVMGKRTLTEIDASGGALGGRGSAQAGYVLGIVGTVLLGLGLLYLVVLVLFIGGMGLLAGRS